MSPVDHVVTSGTFSLDGGTWDVDNNVWIVGNGTECVIIDSPHDAAAIINQVKGRTVKAILLTHAHLDHITGVGRARAALGVPVGLHQADNFLYEAVVDQGRAFGFPVEPQPPVDFFYEPDGVLKFGN